MDTQTLTIPVVEERLVGQTRTVETGRVQIRKMVSTRVEEIDNPLLKDTVRVERIAVNRPVDAPMPVRCEGDTMIVPVFEETVVVEKRLILKEEVHITRHRAETHRPTQVTLRREEIKIERVPSRGEGQEPEPAKP